MNKFFEQKVAEIAEFILTAEYGWIDEMNKIRYDINNKFFEGWLSEFFFSNKKYLCILR